MNMNGNSANFFLYVCNGKKIKKLFASTLNRKPASVKFVSFTIVVYNAKFALKQKSQWETKKPEQSAVFC